MPTASSQIEHRNRSNITSHAGETHRGHRLAATPKLEPVHPLERHGTPTTDMLRTSSTWTTIAAATMHTKPDQTNAFQCILPITTIDVTQALLLDQSTQHLLPSTSVAQSHLRRLRTIPTGEHHNLSQMTEGTPSLIQRRCAPEQVTASWMSLHAIAMWMRSDRTLARVMASHLIPTTPTYRRAQHTSAE